MIYRLFGQADAQHQQGWNDAAGPCQIKAPQGEATLLQPTDDDGGHQEARDHKKDINPDKATGKAGYAKVVQHHRHDGPGAQPVDIVPKCFCFLDGWIGKAD